MKWFIILAIVFHLPKIGNTQQQDSSIFVATGNSSFTWKTPTQTKGLLGIASITGTWADTTRTNLYNAIATKQNLITQGTTGQYLRGDLSLSTFPTIPDSTTYQTKYRSDTARSNLYSAINGKQAAGSYATTAQNALKLNISDTAAMLLAYQNAINGKQASGNYASGVTNTGDNAANSTYANDYRAANFVAGTQYLAPNGSGGSLTGITTAQVGAEPTITTLSFAKGGIGSGAATSATMGTMTVSMVTEMITITPTNACTFNATGGVTGQRVTFIVTTSGTSSFVLTWGTNYRTTGTLATGTTTAKKFCVSFIYDGSTWLETGRTAAM